MSSRNQSRYEDMKRQLNIAFAAYLQHHRYEDLYVITAAKVLNFGTFKKLEETEDLRP